MNLKRAFDIVVGSALVAVSLPLLAGACCASAISLRGSPLYKQKRVGLNGQVFTLYKIKSMRDGFDGAGNALPDSERITKIGKILRASKLDELPQCFNVVAGSMSIVGPRPLQECWTIAHDPKRQSVKPGLTGPTQVTGRTATRDEDILAKDHEYVDSHDFLTDMAYIVKTPISIVKNAQLHSIGNQMTRR